MRKASIRASAADPARLCVAAALLLAVPLALPRAARASAELDRLYALETVGFLKSWDNVDGLFADYVAAAYRDYFSRHSRFVLQEISRAEQVLTRSKLSYAQVIQDREILGQLARSTRTQSILRTKIQKEGPQYRFTLDLLHSPKMDVLATETFLLEERRDGDAPGLGDVKGELQKALDRLIAKLPFKGHVTGRDGSSLTLNIGANENVEPGDTVVIATVDEVKKHPLLGSIVDWRISSTGKAEVQGVEDRISFARVSEEEPNREVARYQKVIQVLKRPAPPEPPVIHEEDELKKKREEMPKLGFVAGNALLGGMSRIYSAPAGQVGRDGGGMMVGGKVDGQLWLNRDFFTELQVGLGAWSFEQQTSDAAALETASAAGTMLTMKAAAGYSYLVTGDFYGPKGWVKAGFRSTSYQFPTVDDPLENMAPISYRSLFIGVGGDLPIRDGFGATLNFDFGLITSGKQTAVPGRSVTSSSEVAFTVGGFYRWTNRITLRACLDILAHGSDLNNGGTVSQKAITLAPAVLYYF
jgi:hypothetical protein